jgi:predicted nucleotidyltransferase
MWTVAQVFFSQPTNEQYLKGISRKTGIAHTVVAKHLAALLRRGFIEKRIERKGRRSFPTYRAAQNEEFRAIKRIDNLLRLQESGLVEFLKSSCAPACIILFGSNSRGEDTETSDIDLYLQCAPKHLELRRFEQVLSRKIQLHFRESFASYPNELKNNIANGTVLSGYLEAFHDHKRAA